jgi:hypothetical protein
MECIVRFTHIHESFRVPELEALAGLVGASLEILSYDESVG